MATEKEALQDRARELGLSDDGTAEDLKARIAEHEAALDAEDLGAAGASSTVPNGELEHTQGGTTTRSDLLDAGVPMTPGHPAEPVGPEDALGRGEKRGDYRDRVVGDPHTSVPVEGGRVTKFVNRETGAEAREGDRNAVEVVVDNQPTARLEAQAPRTEDIGDDKALKGGVQTDPAFASGALGISEPAAAESA